MKVMQSKCDLYLCDSVDASRLKMLCLFDKNFICEGGKELVGYLSVNIGRVKLVAVVSALRQKQILCFGVPVEYRNSGVSLEVAFDLAKKHAGEGGGKHDGSIKVAAPILVF